jgi:hypothetical protein
MYILGFISEGFGNKLYMLTYYIHLFFKIKKYHKLEKLYLVHYDSFHELGKEEEKLYNIFPLLKNQKWLEWIDWDKYSELSKNIKQSISHKEITDYQNVKLPLSSKGFIFSNKHFFQSYNFFMKLYQFNNNYKKLDKSYNFNGIAVHIRLSDKIKYIYDYVIKKKNVKDVFSIFIPEYYTDILKNFSLDTPVYIFTGSPRIFKKIYLPHFKHKVVLVDLSFYESFYLLTKFKNIILSESTFSIIASYFNNKGRNIYGHKYYFKNKRNIVSNLIPYNTNKIESKKYFIKENKEFLKELYKFSKDLKPNIK